MENQQPQQDANRDAGEKPQINGRTDGDEPPVSRAKHHENEKREREAQEGKGKAGEQDKKPAGGFDKTPVPRREPGYTLRITFHRATNLPMADYTSFSSDPYVLAQIDTGLPTRHKEDPPLQLRTPTIRKSTNAEWNCQWIVANIPATGFKMKCRVLDEDPADHDDRLGNAHVYVDRLTDNWVGIQNQAYKIKKRSGSKRAYLVRIFATCIQATKHLNGDLFISVEMLGRTETDSGGRAYTVGPMWYTKHYSPMLGRIAGRKEPDENANKTETKTERYNFQANQFQLHGPVPEQLYHRFVEFKPWVRLMFTVKGARGWFLSKALHHQHNRVYNFSRTTEYGLVGEEPSRETALKFLDLVHHDEGGRIFTYVLTLDGLFRFTETGKEFGIDMLSKHTMHSDVAIYIAFSGEFFIRRLKSKNSPPPPDSADESQPQHPPEPISGGPPDTDPPRDPAQYELVIDNDSGTYRPNADLLPVLKAFLAFNFPGLHILTLDCQKDAKRQQRMKAEQRERKKAEGDTIVYRQLHDRRVSNASSISSSDISDLDEVERAQAEGAATEPGVAKMLGRDVKARGNLRKEHWKSIAKGRDGGTAAQASMDGGAAADELATTTADASASAEKGDA